MSPVRSVTHVSGRTRPRGSAGVRSRRSLGALFLLPAQARGQGPSEPPCCWPRAWNPSAHRRTRSLSYEYRRGALTFVVPQRRARRVEPRTVGMPEGMPADVPESEFTAGLSNVILLDGARVVGSRRNGIREHPTRARRRACLVPAQQDLREFGIEREIAFGKLGFHVVDFTVYHTAANGECEFLEIDVLPLQPENLADPQPHALSHHHHGAIGLGQECQNRVVLLDGQDLWLAK